MIEESIKKLREPNTENTEELIRDLYKEISSLISKYTACITIALPLKEAIDSDDLVHYMVKNNKVDPLKATKSFIIEVIENNIKNKAWIDVELTKD